jgi:hypothetical protein
MLLHFSPPCQMLILPMFSLYNKDKVVLPSTITQVAHAYILLQF